MKNNIAKALVLLSVIALNSCGGGGSSTPPPPPPLIDALLFSYPPTSSLPSFPNALVVILDGTTGADITNANVTMGSGANVVTLTYNSAPTHLDYEGTLLINPGDPVTLVVKSGGYTYTASGNQATSYPTISAPAPGDSWAASETNTVTWSGGAILGNAAYLVGVLDAADPTGGMPYFHATAANIYTLPIPPNSLTVGSKFVIAGITTALPISNAYALSYFILGGYDYVPITVY